MKRIIIAGLLVIVVLFGACTGIPGTDGVAAKDNELTKTVETTEGNFSITVPDSWLKNYSSTDEEMEEVSKVLSYTDNDITFVDVFFYSTEYFDYTLNDSLNYSLEYFGDSIIGEYEEMSLDGMDVLVFETSMVDLSVDDDKYNYHGYFYMINTPYGVVEIDIYYVQEILESKIVKPSEEQLLFLQEIAESFEVN